MESANDTLMQTWGKKNLLAGRRILGENATIIINICYPPIPLSIGTT
jgi:hypothetical protein